MFVVFYLFFTRVPLFIKFVFTLIKFFTWVNKKSKLELRVIIEWRLYARYMTDFSLGQTVQLKFIVLRLKMGAGASAPIEDIWTEEELDSAKGSNYNIRYLKFLLESFKKFDKNGDGTILTKDLGNN